MTQKIEKPKRYRAWTGTMFYDTTDLENTFEMTLRSKCQYYVFGRELCPSTQKFHFQWAAYTRLQMTESAARKLFNCHTEAAHHLQAAIAYCKKGNDFFEWGLAPCQGKRTDLDDVRHRAANGQILDIVDHGNYQQIKVAEKWLEYNAPKRDPKNPVSVIWIYGKSGSGKSKYAWENYPNAYRKMPGKWWDGYASESTVVFDDFDPNDYTEKQLLTWWDRYPTLIEIKGGTRQLFATTFVITALFAPTHFFKTDAIGTQFLRRITNIIDVETSQQNVSEVDRE